MSRRRIGWKRFAVTAAGVLLSFACAFAALGLLVDTGAAKRAIEQNLSEAFGGEVRYDALDLTMLPRPGVAIRAAALRVPGVVEARATALSARLALLPLLAGHVRPTAIRIEQPVVTLSVSGTAGTDAFESYRAAVGPGIEALVRHAPGATITIAGGSLAVDRSGRRMLSVSDVSCDVAVASDAVAVKASAASELWRSARARLRIAADSLAASGTLEIEALNAAGLLVPTGTGNALRALPAPVDAKLLLETDGRASARAALTAATPELTLARGARTTALGAARGTAGILREGAALTVTVSDFSVGGVVRGASGVLRTTVQRAAPSFELKVSSFDIARWYAAESALFDGQDGMSAWLRHLSAGTLHGFSVTGTGAGLHELIDRGAVRAQARLEGATLAVPAAGIEVRQGSGQFQLADGVLRGSALAGELGKSTFRSGTLVLDLVPRLRLLGLAAEVGADLGDALAIARRVLGQREPALLAGIEALDGRAEGRIDYDARRGPGPLVVELAKVRAQGRHRGAPLPLAVRAGDLRYSRSVLRARGLDASAGRSSVRRADIELALTPEPAIRSAKGEAVLVLDEVFPWLRGIAAPELRLAELTAATGTARVRLARLSGALARPAALDFEATIEPDGMRIEAAALPGPLTATGGSGVLSGRTLRLDRVALATGDARLTVSGTVNDYRSAARSADLDIAQGSIGAQGLDWLRVHGGIPAAAMPRAPAEVAAARVRWPAAGAGPRAVQGRVRVGGAVDADFDLAWQAGAFDLRHLAVKDADSDATAAASWKPGSLQLAFKGVFDARTLARALAQEAGDAGTIRGDLRVAADLRAPHRSSATGEIEGAGLDLARRFDLPVTMERVKLAAAGRVLQVREGRFAVDGQHLSLTGSIAAREASLVFDTALEARELDPARLLRAFTRVPAAGAASAAPASQWNLPVSGRIGFAVESLALGRYVLRGTRGALALAPSRVIAEATQARLCGAAAPFTAALEPRGVDVTVRIQARSQALAEALPCLTGKAVEVTGSYDLDAEFAAAGPYAAPFASLAGKFRFAARGGRVRGAELLARTMTVDEVAKRLEAPASHLMGEGFVYDEIAASGTVRDGTVRVEHGVLDSASLGATVSGDIALADGRLALQGLIAPFDAAHRNLRRVPVLGRAFGSLVVIPVGISGTLGDPQVRVQAAAAVGATLLNLMTARFLLPINLFDIGGAGPPVRP